MNRPDLPSDIFEDDEDDDSLQAEAVTADTWVTVHYQIFDSTNQPVEDAPREMRYLHGNYGAIFPKLETALEGKKKGQSASSVLQPEDAFGDYEADRLHIIDADRLPEGSEAGMTFEGLPGEPGDGLVYTLTDLAQGKAVLDGNHPLAGISLRYEMTVKKIGVATAEEIEQEKRETGQDKH